MSIIEKKEKFSQLINKLNSLTTYSNPNSRLKIKTEKMKYQDKK